ncbi:MAG: class IV adenylate cyclase [Candidatus Babeliales bacterium]|jgi:adenylate cyclase class 2|nr:MAG: Adenylyl cyclase CyaB [candidate division TM6 bacterium GW2011_GWF2_36_6]
MSKEIEIKIKLEINQIEQLREWLIQNAKFMDKLQMIDYYLDDPKKSLYKISPAGFKDPLEFWRVRQIDNVYFLCNKKRIIDENGRTVSVEENEAVTPEGEAIIQIFKKRGLTDQVIIYKTREIFQYEDFEIVFDNVKNLGEFVEIELKSDEQDPVQGKKLIYDLLKKIGITEFTQFDRGYLCMMLNPKSSFGEKVELNKTGQD